MKTIQLTLILLCITLTGFAQVGIGNTDPKSTLDISASDVTTPTNEDGILIPRIDNFPTTNPTADQDGMMVFVTGNGATTKGFYYWDDTTDSWINVTGVKKIDDLEDGKSDSDGSDDGSSIFLGSFSGGNDNGDNNRNVGIGFNAMANNTSGSSNTAIGYQSLLASFTGSSNTSFGSYTLWNTTGSYNTAVGSSTMLSNTTGQNNTGLGFNALSSNTTGTGNVAIGPQTLNNNSTGINNIAIGMNAGIFTSGSNNIFLGTNSGENETGNHKLYIENSNADSDNALIYGEFDNNILRTNGEFQIGNPTGTGYAFPTTDGTAGQVMITDGAGNVSFQNDDTGNDWSLLGNAGTGSGVNFIGTTDNEALTFRTNNIEKLRLSTRGQIIPLNTGNSIYIGENAGNQDDFDDNNNIGIGYQALASNTTSGNNIGIGYQAMLLNLTGSSNSAIGFRALYSNVDGFQNVANGYQSLFSNTSGDENIAIGAYALRNNTTGGKNVVVGDEAGRADTFSENNVYIGAEAGGGVSSMPESKSNNVFIGFRAGYGEDNSNRLYIENSGTSTPLIYGEFDNNILRTYGEFQINDPSSGGFSFPTADGTNGQVMTTDGNGNVTFEDLPTKAVARIAMSTTQTETGGGTTKVNFDTRDFDIGSNFSLANDNYVVPVDGLYRVTAQITMAANTGTGNFGVRIRVDGTQQRRTEFNHRGSGTMVRQVTSILNLNAGEIIDVSFTRPGVGATIQADARASFFEIEQL